MTSESCELLASFLAYEEGRGARPRGVKELRSPVTRFLVWLEDGNLMPGELDRRIARSYVAYLRSCSTSEGEALSARTIRAYVQAASRLARYLVFQSTIQGNPFERLRLPRNPKTVIRNVPTESEMEKVLSLLADWEVVGSDTRKQGRQYIAHLVAELQYASGLRIAEVADLELDDLDLAHRRVYVREGKKGKGRVAFLTEYAANLLSVYITRMRPCVLTAKQAENPEKLFGCGYEALSHSQNAHLAHVSAALGIKLTTHSFRHALGYHLLRAGCPLRQIQEILGHDEIKDTEIYTKVDERAVQDVLDQYHPRGKEQLGHAS